MILHLLLVLNTTIAEMDADQNRKDIGITRIELMGFFGEFEIDFDGQSRPIDETHVNLLIS